ncbi:Deubiquitinating enzyme MINDY-3/4 conserved domain containing protein [Lotmaria passim]
MPPKKLKDLADAPVYKMTHEEQVQLLSDALLREYMHRRGFCATLKAFDEEHPRDDNTISSRALMSDLMALEAADQQRMKADGIETIMEMLCNLRVERRVEVERLTAEVEAPLPKVPAKYDALKAKLVEREARREKRQKGKKAKKVAFADDAGSAESKSKSRGKPPRPDSRVTGIDATTEPDLTIDDLLGSSHSGSGSDSGASGSSDSESDDRGNTAIARHGSTKRASGQTTTSRSQSDTGSTPQSASTSKSNLFSPAAATAAKTAVAPVQPAWMELEKRASKKDSSDVRGAASQESSDVASSEDADDVQAASLGGDPLSAELRDEMSAAFQLLCGFDGSLTRTFVEQGFTFDEELDCGLIQWRPGGCDAVVAPLQAFVAAYFYEREVYVQKEQRQKDCLLRALSTVLEQAQPNASKVVLVDGLWRLKGGQTRFTRGELRQQASTARTRCWTQLRSAEDVRDVLRSTLLSDERWMKPRGSGLLSFVLSLLLSRGVDVVQKELSAGAAASGNGGGGGRPSLLSSAADGHATVALANLVLSGRATSFCHNGVQNGGQVGYAAKLKCGMLVGDAARAEAEASLPSSTYTNAMEPVLPSWVVQHKNRYANLYMTKDTRQVFQQKLNLGGSASEDVVYWDAATEDDAYVLTVTVRSVTLGVGSSGGVRNAKSFVNTAITSVPVWSSAEINWNGEAPLRD